MLNSFLCGHLVSRPYFHHQAKEDAQYLVLIGTYHAETDKYLQRTLSEVSSRDTITCNFIPAFAVIAHLCGSTLRRDQLEEELEVLLFDIVTCSNPNLYRELSNEDSDSGDLYPSQWLNDLAYKSAPHEEIFNYLSPFFLDPQRSGSYCAVPQHYTNLAKAISEFVFDRWVFRGNLQISLFSH